MVWRLAKCPRRSIAGRYQSPHPPSSLRSSHPFKCLPQVSFVLSSSSLSCLPCYGTHPRHHPLPRQEPHRHKRHGGSDPPRMVSRSRMFQTGSQPRVWHYRSPYRHLFCFGSRICGDPFVYASQLARKVYPSDGNTSWSTCIHARPLSVYLSPLLSVDTSKHHPAQRRNVMSKFEQGPWYRHVLPDELPTTDLHRGHGS